MPRIRFSLHAEWKFEVVRKTGFPISRERVLAVLRRPDRIETKRHGVKIAQGILDDQHVLRVVFRHEGRGIKIITFHPGDRRRYEKEKSEDNV